MGLVAQELRVHEDVVARLANSVAESPDALASLSSLKKSRTDQLYVRKVVLALADAVLSAILDSAQHDEEFRFGATGLSPDGLGGLPIIANRLLEERSKANRIFVGPSLQLRYLSLDGSEIERIGSDDASRLIVVCSGHEAGRIRAVINVVARSAVLGVVSEKEVARCLDAIRKSTASTPTLGRIRTRLAARLRLVARRHYAESAVG